MRNFATLMALAAISFQGLAQKEVVSAYNANKEGDYATAASYIEQAIENPKANVKNKTWRYRGEIYLNISKDSTLFAAFPDALTIAKDSYMKAKSWTPKGRTPRSAKSDWVKCKWRQATPASRSTTQVTLDVQVGFLT